MTSTQVGLARYCPVKSIVQKQNQSVTEGFTEFTQCSPVSYLAGSLLKEGNRCSIHLSYEGSITKFYLRNRFVSWIPDKTLPIVN